jgi:hypothetical protein
MYRKKKKNDSLSFTIPCSIGKLSIGKALCDLEASINLMPFSMLKKLEGVKPAKMKLSLLERFCYILVWCNRRHPGKSG